MVRESGDAGAPRLESLVEPGMAEVWVKLEGANNWVVEDFGEFPARLMGLRSTGRVGGVR